MIRKVYEKPTVLKRSALPVIAAATASFVPPPPPQSPPP
jgi:hypothetical protein